jgi:hypothetical protein
MCEANLSGWHVPSQRGDCCRCGRKATADELEQLRQDRLEFEAAELRARYRLGLAVA